MSLLALQELIVCLFFVAVVVKSFPGMYVESMEEVNDDELIDDEPSNDEPSKDEPNDGELTNEKSNNEESIADIDRKGHDHHKHHHAHSYHHFVGPVTGHHEKIAWKDKHGHHHHDYKAHPKYKYSYGVDDDHTKDHHGQKEHRNGKNVEGEYHVQEPGGNLRSVKYHSDSHGGFYAEVHNYGGNDHSGGTYHKHR
ncbi:cuticular protein 11 isoform X1 [Cardiocondyla obscurior]